ncbi:MAG: mechanosensitive ion channel [Chitinivibrionales bacterium]|nr:mechanosensitive ion channel [Chitinivibrionales bacterium]
MLNIYLIPFKQQFTEFAEIFTDFIQNQQWITVFILIFGTFVIERIIVFLFNRVTIFARKTRTEIDDLIVKNSSRPVGNFVLLFGAFLIANVLRLPLEPFDVKKFLLVAIKIGVVLNGLWLCFRIIDIVGVYLLHRIVKTSSRLDDQLVPIFQKTIKVFLFILGMVYIIQALGYSVSGIIAGLGIGGLAVAMAAKDTLANFFGSMMILADRPFKKGDWIKIQDNEGVVEEIGFRSTRIRTFPKTLISIPNSVLANESIDNYTRMPKRRVKMTVGVTYETTAEQMENAVKGIEKLLTTHEDVSQEFMMVKFTDFGASSLDILVYYFTNTTDWSEHLAVRQEINLAIMRLIENMGLSIAFPTRTLHVKQA